jgi:pimeloyl-ACP methyl ester carboxylesterase
MTQKLAGAKLIIYSHSGHGVLFHHPEEFGKEVLDFLA